MGATQRLVDARNELSMVPPAVRDWLARHAASAVGVVFALGFAWAQFAALQSGLAETRLELKELRDAFLSFRVGDVASHADLDRALEPLQAADRRFEDELRRHERRIEDLIVGLLRRDRAADEDGT